jgi:hypothetical protein
MGSMKRFVTALIAASLSLPAGAALGSSHGGFAGHSAPASHGGFGSAHGSFGGAGRTGTPFRSAAPARSFPTRSFAPRPYAQMHSMSAGRGYTPGYASNFARTNARGYNNRPAYGDHRPYRPDHHRPVYWGGILYTAPAWGWGAGWFDPYYLGYPDDYGYDDNDDGQAAVYQDYSQQDYPPYDQEPYDSSPYPGQAYSYAQSYPQPAASTPAPTRQAITLIFKDGRPSLQVQNYMLTANTLYVIDKQTRQIPVAELDLEATAKANREAGLDFTLPGR